MADELKFSVSLEDRVSGAATRAAETMRKFSSALGDARTKLEFFESQLKLATAAGNLEGQQAYGKLVREASAQVYELANAVGPQLNGAMNQSAQAMHRHAASIFRIVEPTEVARHAIEAFGKGFREMGTALAAGEAKGVISGVTEAIAGLASALDIIVPGLGQASAAVVKLTGSFAAMAAGAVQAGVETALEVSALNNQLRATFDALGTQGPNSGARTLDMLNRLSATLPQSRERLAEYAKSFEALGFTGLGQLRYQIKATAAAQAIMGDTGAEAYEHMSRKIRLAVEAHQGLKLGERPLEQIYKMGSNATDVAGRLGLTVKQLRMQLEAGTINAQAFGNALSASLVEKGQGPIDAMMRSWDVLKRKGSEVWQHLFDDVDVTPLTNAIAMVIELGNQGEPSGHAMKKGITAGLNGIIHALGEATIEGAAFFLHLEAKAIRLETRLRPITHAIEAIFRFVSSFDLGNLATSIATAGANLAIPGVGSAAQLLGAATSPTKPVAGAAARFQSDNTAVSAHREPRTIGGMSKASIATVVQIAAATAKPADHSVHIGQVNITAPAGVTDAQSVSVTGLGAALERVQLMGAR